MHGGCPYAPRSEMDPRFFERQKRGRTLVIGPAHPFTSSFVPLVPVCSSQREIKKDRTMRLTLFFPPSPSIPPPLYIYIYARTHTHTVILLRPFYRAAAELLLHYRSSGENKTSKLHLQLTVRAIERSIPPSHRFISPRSLVFDSSTRLVKIEVRIERFSPIHRADPPSSLPFCLGSLDLTLKKKKENVAYPMP